jgi:hypothetical protein
MSNRYSISSGRNSNGAINYGINDNMPTAGSDGRLMDTSDPTIANDVCAMLNQRHEAEALRMRLDNNLEWRYNGRCYSWERVPPVMAYID